MNTNNSSVTNSGEGTDLGRRPVSDIFESVKNRSVYARLITPPGFRPLIIATAFALLNGFMVFLVSEDRSGAATGDLATSFAFITLFSFVLGTWLSAKFEVILIKLMTRAFDILEHRIIRLIERVSELGGEHPETAQPTDDGPTDYRAAVIKVLYFLSFPSMSVWLIFWVLRKFTYADSPLAVSQIQSAINMYTAFMYVSLAAGGLLVCWTSGRIIWAWYRVSMLEKKIDATVLETSIRSLVPMNTNIASYITNAHAQTMRFVTGAF